MANTVNIMVDADSKKAQKGFKDVTKVIAGVSLAVAGIGLALAKIGDEFTEATTIIKSGTGASGKDLESLQDSFRELNKSVPDDMADVAKAIADVNTELGLTGEDLEGTTRKFLDFSRVMGTDSSTSIKQVSDLLDSFGLGAEDVGTALDKFTVASQTSGVGIDKLTMFVHKFAPTLKTMELGLDDSIAMMASMGDAGIDISRIMPTMSTALAKMAKTGGVSAQEAFQAVIREMINAETHLDAVNIGAELFGDTGAVKMADAARLGAFDIDTLSGALSLSKGALDNVNAGSLTSADRFDIMKKRAKLLVEPLAGIASALFPFVVMMPALISGISALASMTMVQTAATWLWTAAQTALSLAMSPMGLVIIGIVAAVAAAIIIWKNWDKIIAFVTDKFNLLDKFLTGKFPEAWSNIKTIVSGFFEFFKGILNGFVSIFQGDFDGAFEHFKEAFAEIKKIWDLVFNLFPEPVKNAINIIVQYFSGLIEVITGLFEVLWSALNGDIEGVISGFKKLANGVITSLNAIIKAINSIKFDIPLIGEFGGAGIPEIPQLANGGIVSSPTLAMIGERGAEAVVPLNGKNGGVGGVTVNVNLSDSGIVILDDESTAQKFGDMVTKQVRQALRTQGAF